ncbi:hypothetical protein [Desulfocurvus sp. DL9XJH121]
MRGICICLVLALGLMSAAPALAADAGPAVRLEARAGVAAPADFDDRDGGVSVARAGVSAFVDRFRLDYDLRTYHWDDGGELPLGGGSDEPWDSLHSLALSAQGGGHLGGAWGWFWTARGGAAWEEEMDDAFSAAAGGGVSYALGRDLSLRAGGVLALGPLGWKALPLASLAWREGAEQGFSAGLGLPGSHVTYRFDSAWALRLSGTMEDGVWRLADDSAVERKGYLRESGIRAGLYALWSPLENLDLRFGPEWTFARSMSVYNDDGEKRSSYGLGSALGASATLGYRF